MTWQIRSSFLARVTRHNCHERVYLFDVSPLLQISFVSFLVAIFGMSLMSWPCANDIINIGPSMLNELSLFFRREYLPIMVKENYDDKNTNKQQHWREMFLLILCEVFLALCWESAFLWYLG